MEGENNLIMITDKNLIELVQRTISHLEKLQGNKKHKERWVDGETAKKRMGVKSDTTLQRFRDEGKIRFAKISKKIIMYDSISIDDFLESNSHETF